MVYAVPTVVLQCCMTFLLLLLTCLIHFYCALPYICTTVHKQKHTPPAAQSSFSMEGQQHTARLSAAPTPPAPSKQALTPALTAAPPAATAPAQVAAVKRSEQDVRTQQSDAPLLHALVPYAPALPPLDESAELSVEDIIVRSAALAYDVRKWQTHRGMLITVHSTLQTLSHWLDHWQSRQSPRAQLFHYLLIELHRYFTTLCCSTSFSSRNRSTAAVQ
jgi:hypothetical protein